MFTNYIIMKKSAEEFTPADFSLFYILQGIPTNLASMYYSQLSHQDILRQDR